MVEHDWLAARFEANRSHLRAVAYRMLGSTSEAEDAVQEAWLRLNRADTSDVTNLEGWLTTVVGRVCLDMLRSRTSRREEPLDTDAPAPIVSRENGIDPEREAVLTDSVGLALLVVLDTLAPAERLAFVLHDVFAMPFDEIAPIVERSPAATRQLASRARRRVQGAQSDSVADRVRQREVVHAFLAASREGDFGTLLTLLDPEVVLRADRVAVAAARKNRAKGAPPLAPEVRGAETVAGILFGRTRGAQPAIIDGVAGAAWAPGGRPRALFAFTVAGGQITAIEVIADPRTVREIDVAMVA
jgi:RNA polymerase sigma-70 factor (ECF subfamily)